MKPKRCQMTAVTVWTQAFLEELPSWAQLKLLTYRIMTNNRLFQATKFGDDMLHNNRWLKQKPLEKLNPRGACSNQYTCLKVTLACHTQREPLGTKARNASESKITRRKHQDSNQNTCLNEMYCQGQDKIFSFRNDHWDILFSEDTWPIPNVVSTLKLNW